MKYKIWWDDDFAANIDGYRIDFSSGGSPEDEVYDYYFYNMTWLLKSTSNKVGADI